MAHQDLDSATPPDMAHQDQDSASPPDIAHQASDSADHTTPEEEPEPVELLTCMTLASNSKMLVYSTKSDIKIIIPELSITKYINHPYLVGLGGPLPTYIESCAPLDHRFAAGWNSLSTELKGTYIPSLYIYNPPTTPALTSPTNSPH